MVFVGYMGEKESLRRHTDSSCAAVFLLDDGVQLRDGEFATSDIEESTCNRAYHIAQEAVGGDGENEHFVFPIPMGFGKVADIGFVVRVQFCETGEIIVLHECVCGDVHSVDVGVEIDAAIKSLPEREPGRGDEIFIGARSGRETSMEVVGDVEDVENGDVGREETVEFEDEIWWQ